MKEIYRTNHYPYNPNKTTKTFSSPLSNEFQSSKLMNPSTVTLQMIAKGALKTTHYITIKTLQKAILCPLSKSLIGRQMLSMKMCCPRYATKLNVTG